jgi:hypothetical protein
MKIFCSREVALLPHGNQFSRESNLRVLFGFGLSSVGVFLALMALSINSSSTAVAAGANKGVTIIHSYHNDVSPAMRDVNPWPVHRVQEHEAAENPKVSTGFHRDMPDLVVQKETLLGRLAPSIPAPILNFAGIPFPGVGCSCAPPDTNGEVGVTQYVQSVNRGYQVFDKATGASVLGPLSIVSVWTGFGGVCETSGLGDPVVLYDQLANRWIISEFAGSSIPTDECIAVSTTSDATGTFNRYAFHIGSNFFDYEKISVWPDAYYMSAIIFDSSGTTYLGPQAYAMDRASMLAGQPATLIAMPILGASFPPMLPSDFDGSTLPPPGAPNSFVLYPDTGTYRVFHFHVDFAVPANSTFTLFGSSPAAGFTAICPSTRSCVPELGQSSINWLDAIGDRLMFRLAYRNFGDHEAVVGNFTVSSNGLAGIRWFELRGVIAGPVTTFQESTYQPDTTWRFQGSIAMDQQGNMALGYSASDATIFPQLRYTGRLATDPLNSMPQGEAHLFDGTGAQTDTFNRWGDYSDMTIDPVDDCTFWYTTEYYDQTSSFNWRTRIGNFKFAECGGGGGGGGVLWYNGDFDGVDALGNEQDTSLGAGQFSHIYDDFNVTDSGGWDLTSVFSDNLADTNITGATFEIRSGVSSGVPGTIVASGTTLTPVVTATDRSGFGFTEFMVEVTGLDIHLDAGTYFLNVTPIGDLTGRSFDSTTSGANCIGTPCGDNANSFWDSNFFGVFFVPSSDAGVEFHDFSMGVNGTIVLGPPTITTQASGSVPVGGNISDTATLSNGITPTGTITFMLFGPDDATCGGAPVFTSTKDVTGNGSYISDSFTPTAAGTYRWVASYSGDVNNDPVNGACNDPNESVIVTVVEGPTITTLASGSVQVGGDISDTATLSNGVTPTGTITFMLFGPNDATCGGTAVFTSTKNVTGNGSYISDSFTPTAAGTYRWVASYSGDVNNDPATGVCNDPNESVVVTSSPPPPPVITSSGSASGIVGQPFSYQITATNNPTSFDATGLPLGLTRNTSTGLISGTPSQDGTFAIILSATNAGGTGMKTLTLVVTATAPEVLPPIITSPLSMTATVDQFYVYQIIATDSPTSYAATNLPLDLSIDPVLGFISGTPREAGTRQVTLSATNANGTGTAILTLTVQAAPVSGISVISGTSITGRTGSPFKYQVVTSGGSAAARISAAGLPPGLQIDPVTGEISGSATSDGSSSVTLTVTEAGMSTTSTLQLSFTSDPAIPVITSPGSATLIPGQPFTYTIVAPSSSDEPTTFYNIGPFPPGLGLDSATGVISGTPPLSFGLAPTPGVSTGVVTNTEIVACNSSGCADQSLFYQDAAGAENISTRLSVGTEANVLIGGFIIQGKTPMTPMEVVVRGIGPSLAQYGVPVVLANPYLELHDLAGAVLGANDNWKDDSEGGSQEVEIENTGFAPTNSAESAIHRILDPGAYTAIVKGANDGTGVGLVEVYNLGPASLDKSSEANLGNISTRGNVQTGDNVMIGGFINEGSTPIKVVVRGIGPSLAAAGVTGALANPYLTVYDAEGAVIGANDNWATDPTQKTEIMATGFAPANELESAILITLPMGKGAYTAIVRGVNDTTGVALVEAYFGNPCLGSGSTEVCP